MHDILVWRPFGKMVFFFSSRFIRLVVVYAFIFAHCRQILKSYWPQ